MIIDFPALRERAADDDELVRELLTDFLAGEPAMVRAITEAASPLEAQRAAHRLRGALLALCAHPAARAAEAVEAGAGDVARLRDEVAAATAAMRAYVAS